MKGEEQLWTILNDKLDTLRATNRLPQAIRVAETALEIAKRAFRGTDLPLATSFEKLGQLLDQKGDRAAAKGYLLKARSEEHTSELQSRPHLVCRLLLEKKNTLQRRQREQICPLF